MIICISVNPAIDRTVWLDELQIGSVNRAARSRFMAGGKAAHVAMVARALGVETIWIGLLGGATGDDCERQLNAMNLSLEVVRTRSSTRVNQEIIDSHGTVTEVLEPGGAVAADEAEKLLSVCLSTFQKYEGDLQVVLSGSLPPGMDHDFYGRLICAVHARGGFVVLDTSGDALANSLSSYPDLVKPNRDEAEALLGRNISDQTTAAGAAREFMNRGAKSVVVSLGSDGFLWMDAGEAAPLLARPPISTGLSTVGCGDATVAGFVVARSRHQSSTDTAILAAACGAANCFASAPGLINVDDVQRMLPLIEISHVEFDGASTTN